MVTLPRRFGRAAIASALAATAITAVVLSTRNATADTGAACSAAYSIQWQTPSNNPPDFGVDVTVTNNAAYTISNWTVSWTYTAGQALIAGSAFSANVVQSGSTVTATPGGSFNATLTPGQSAAWGFHATYNGTSNPIPTVTCTGPSQGSSSATLSGSLQPLGVNTAAWDTNFVDPAIATSMSAAHIGLTRYPGGSWADQYLWQPNTVNGSVQPVNFAQFSTQVNAVTGGQKFVTIDYGSDTAASAGAWAKQAATTAGQGVALWEIGNEVYGSWETDNHAGAHTASSYATNALPYMQAVKAADPSAQMCYDYAMDGGLAPGAGVDGWQTWNSTILQADASAIDCADVHWYPINGTPTETDQSIMELIDNIPAAAAEIKSALSTYDPTAYFVVGETNMSQTANAWNEQPIGALFAAGNAMEWLSFGAQSVDWWDVHNYGSPTADFGMFSSATSGEPAMNTPYPPYYGYLLASKLAVKGAKVGTLAVATPDIYGYYANLPGGGYGVMLANANPSTGYTLTTSSLGITGGTTTEYLYNKANPTITTSTLSGTSVTVPAESVLVLTSGTGTPPSTSPSASAPGSPSPSVTRASSAPPSSSPSASRSQTPSQSPSTRPTSASPTPASPTPASPSPTGGGTRSCTAAYSVANSWDGGFIASVNVTAGSAAITGWRVTLTLPNGTAITNLWGGVNTGTTGTVQVANQSYNGSVGAGQTTNFGFQGSGPGSGVTATCTAT